MTSTSPSLSPTDTFASGSKQSSRRQVGGRLSVYLPMDDGSSTRFPLNIGDSPDLGNRPPHSPSLIHPIYADPATLPPGFVMPLPSPDAESARELWQQTEIEEKKRSSMDAGRPGQINVAAANDPNVQSQVPYRQRVVSPIYSPSPLNLSTNGNGPNANRPLPPLMVAFQNLPPGLQQTLDSPMAWLAYYFVLNLGLTLYNKFVLVKFPYPWALTGMHSLCGALGSFFLLQQGFFVQARLGRRESVVLILFSMLYTINIAVSNLSLNLVTVPFHQVVRATTPIFTILINVGFLSKKTPLKVYLSLIPVVMGVGAATYGEYAFTLWGFCLTVLGALLAAVKGIATNVLLVGRLKLHPLDLLLRMSPLAFAQCVVYSYSTGELAEVREYGATEMDRSRAFALLLNGVFAFALNVVSFSANKKTSALTMTVAANVKQVLTILWAVWLFNVVLTPMNTLGIALTLFGGGYYAYVDHQIKQERKERERINANTSPLMEVVEKR